MRKFLKNPAVKRLTTISERYKRRHGPQHAAAITYFSVLTLVPVLMLAGAATGFTLAVLRPEWFHLLSDGIVNALGSTDLAKKAVDVLQNAIKNWYGLAGTALIAAVYSGSNWVGNLRIGFCRMLQTNEQETEREQGVRGVLKELGGNLLVFLGLFACLLLPSGIAVIGTTWIGSAGVIGWLAHLLLTFLVSWLLLAFLFCTLPRNRIRSHSWLLPSTVGAALVALLQQFAGVLLGIFTSNPTAVVFGPVIVVMILFNLLSTILLLCAAWAGERIGVDCPLVDPHNPKTANHQAEKLPDPTPVIPVDVAAQGVRAGTRIGYGMGTVTGLGLGAAMAALLTRYRHRGD